MEVDMARVLFAGIGALAITIGLAAGIQSQTAGRQEKPETVKIRSTEVVVDAVVVDRKNRLVTDLTSKDFEVYEDGVPQEVSSFRLVRGANEEPAERRAAHQTVTAADDQRSAGEKKAAAGPETSPNLIIALLDYSSTEFRNKRLIQEGAARYVEKRLQPNDFMAVFMLGSSLQIASDFTNDRDKLIAALKSSSIRGTALASDRADLSGTIQKGDSPENQIDVEGGGA